MEKYKKVIIKHKIKRAVWTTAAFPFKLVINNKEAVILTMIALKLYNIDIISEISKLLELLK